MLTLQQAQAAITQRNSSNSITPADVVQLLANVKGTTLASIVQVTQVKTAAAHKAENVQKVTAASVQLFNNVKDFANVYAAAVKRSAGNIADNDATKVNNFEQQDSYFAHTSTFSLVQHKTDASKFYLYAIYNNADSLYFINNTLATKQEVAQLLTPAAARDLLNPTNVVHNVTNDVMHTVQVRTISLDSIVQLKAQRQTLTV
jgi:hypothetical protein